MDNLTMMQQDFDQLMEALKEIQFFKPGELCVIGCSTSEVLGHKIGTDSSMEVAQYFYEQLMKVSLETGVTFCFQGCEHINRAITIESDALTKLRDYTKVNVKPVRKAGGSMSTYAFEQMVNPCVIEHIQVDCGIDIGQTLIGMHVKHVQVPVRVPVKQVGEAIVTLCTHRDKLIGGSRAHYQ
ncbi:TIGR01440 family protein [Macrococcus sp. DPC7161]|uniref:TIGR01440 family protein n=1 Tax=Macrococcus sp. DPC7161 TaxID=2507060 RepID=UPI001F0C572C|nr:TIGR01440 family protein [Macrococcus sp. DPC7161]